MNTGDSLSSRVFWIMDQDLHQHRRELTFFPKEKLKLSLFQFLKVICLIGLFKFKEPLMTE